MFTGISHQGKKLKCWKQPISTITANGALIYNSTNSNKAVCVLAFGGDNKKDNS